MTMPKNVKKSNTTTSGQRKKTKPSVKRKPVHRREVPEQIEIAAARIAQNVVRKMVSPVIPNISVPVSQGAGNRSTLLAGTARIAGGAVALGSILITAPLMFVVQAFMMIGRSDDLKSREYRDDAGRIHHHTRIFMQDHASDERILAA